MLAVIFLSADFKTKLHAYIPTHPLVLKCLQRGASSYCQELEGTLSPACSCLDPQSSLMMPTASCHPYTSEATAGLGPSLVSGPVHREMYDPGTLSALSALLLAGEWNSFWLPGRASPGHWGTLELCLLAQQGPDSYTQGFCKLSKRK